MNKLHIIQLLYILLVQIWYITSKIVEYNLKNEVWNVKIYNYFYIRLYDKFKYFFWIIIYHTFKLKIIGKIMTYQKKTFII